jgi:hypothetical protein
MLSPKCSVPAMATPRGAVPLLEGIVVELQPLLASRLRALRVKTQALASTGAGDGGDLAASLLGGVVFGGHDLHSARVAWLPGCVALSSALEDAEAAASGRWL